MDVYSRCVDDLAGGFLDNPINFVTETDLQVQLIKRLQERLNFKNNNISKLENPELKNKNNSYKEDYCEEIQSRLEQKERIDRVHAEASVRKGERIDVVVFKPEMENRIEWVQRGSKRFRDQDIETAIEIKYVKNKYKFPTKTGITIKDLNQRESIGDLESKLDFEENNIKPDIEELNRLRIDNKYLLIFSNNNYLYQNPTEKELNHTYGSIYKELGDKVVEWLKRKGEKLNIKILYCHPKGKQWINK